MSVPKVGFSEPLPFHFSWTCYLCVFFLLDPSWSLADPAKFVPTEPPVRGQPENFSGAVGIFKMEAEASTTELLAEDPLTLRVRINSVGIAQQPPKRPNLRQLPKLKILFVVQDLPQSDRTSEIPGGQSWEYSYLLKPRNQDVRAIPALFFVYYRPGVFPPVKGYCMTASRSIPLVVHPRTKAPISDRQGNTVLAPDQFYSQREGSAVLRRDMPPKLPPMGILLLLLLLPASLCAGWYAIWRRLYPDAARLARHRRSRAARQAIKTLHAGKHESAEERAKRAIGVMGTYLHLRLDLPSREPTPAEVAVCLESKGLPAELSAKTADFFRMCDMVLYGPPFLSGREEMTGAAERLILALESES